MIDKNLNFEFNHKEQVDKLYKSMTADEIKQNFDSRGENIRDYIYGLIDALAAIDGAKNIGFDNSTVYLKLTELIKGLNDNVISAEDANKKVDELLARYNDQVINAGNSNSEVVDARGGNINLKARLDKSDSQLADIEKQVNEPFYLFVGANQKYKTIQSAVDEWKNPLTINKRPTLIKILKGEYNEIIKITEQCNISFVGESKHDVIWRTKTGLYDDAPLFAQGEMLIKDITFISDHTENAGFNGTSCGYALHIDIPNVSGTTKVINCDCISYQNSAIGCGTRTNQTLYFENVNCYSYSDNADSEKTYGFLYHTSGSIVDINEKLIMKNVNCFSDKGKAITLTSQASSNPNKVLAELINVNCSSNTFNGEDLIRYYTTGRIQLTANCYGNNVKKINVETPVIVQKYVLSGDDGVCKRTNDLNNVLCGYFMANGSEGDLNTPTSAWCIGHSIAYSSKFVVQYAWLILSSFKKYRRVCNNGTWGAWQVVTETLT